MIGGGGGGIWTGGEEEMVCKLVLAVHASNALWQFHGSVSNHANFVLHFFSSFFLFLVILDCSQVVGQRAPARLSVILMFMLDSALSPARFM